MTIKLKNRDLKNVADFLRDEVGAKGKKNYRKMRVVKAIEEQDKQVREEEVELLKEYAKLDDEGEIIFLDNGQPIIEDKKEFNEVHKELFEEDFILDDSNLQSSLETVEKLVEDYPKELKGKWGVAHYALMEAFVNAEEEQEETKEGEEE